MSGRVGRLLRRGRADERGAVLPLTAIGLVAALAATSLTVDIGRIANRRRDLQAVADLVAIDASRSLAGRSLGTIVAAADVFLGQLEASAQANRFLEGAVVRTPGTADATDAFLPEGTFTNGWSLRSTTSEQRLLVVLGTAAGDGTFTPVQVAPPVLPEGASQAEVDAATQAAVDAANATIVDAVRVVAHDRIEHQFSPGANTTSRAGVASAVAAGGVGIRSTLASVEGSLLDQAAERLLHAELRAADYEALGAARVTFQDLATHFAVGSLAELLELELTADELFAAYATILQRDPAAAAAASVMSALSTSVGTPAVKLLELVSIAPGGDAAALAASLDAYSLVTGTAFVIGKTHAVTLDVTTTVPGVATVPVEVTVVEPPQWAFGPRGTVARTAQVRAVARPQIAFSTATVAGDKCQLEEKGLVTGLLECTVLGLLQVVPVSNLARVDVAGVVELDLSMARGTATLADLRCAAEGVEPIATLDPIAASALTASRTGSLAVRAVLLPGGTNERTVPLGSVSVVGETNVAPRQVPGISFDAVPDDGDPKTAELPDLGAWTGTGGFTTGIGTPQIDIPWVPDPAPVLDVVSDQDETVGQLATTAFQHVVDEHLEPLHQQIPSALEAGLRLGLAGVEVLAVPPSCAGMRLVG